MSRPGGALKLLVIRRDNIGDLACTTPLIDALRARYPEGWIGALVNTYNAEVLAGNPALDAVYAYEKLKHRAGSLMSNFGRRMALYRELRAQRIDYVLVPSPSEQALRMARRLGGRRVLFEGASVGHEVERAFSLGAELGLRGPPGPLRVYPDPVTAHSLAPALRVAPPLVAVHVSARRPAQRWPAERYAEVIRELKRQATVVLLWAPGSVHDPRHPGDDELAAQLSTEASPVALPTPDLKTLIAALSFADRVVCPDGGAMHLAAALGKPIVALFGDSPTERWRPWGVPCRVLQPASRSLADLHPAEVLAAYRELSAQTV